MHAALEFELCHHLRHLRVVAAVSDAHRHLVLKVDAVYLLQKAVHEVLTCLFAVANDVQACVLLQLDPQQRGIALGLQQLVALRLPLRPKFLRFGQPGGFGQATCNERFKHGGLLGWLRLWVALLRSRC